MFRKLRLNRKWKKLRLRVWERRLLRQLNRISGRLPKRCRCSLLLAWGPFYGGSVVLNRSCTKAKIMIRLPYDRYVTSNERQVMAKYDLSASALPYFIFFHECFHLIDAFSHFERNIDPKTYQAALTRAARGTVDYRTLRVEARADEFAYRRYADLRQKAG